MCICIYRLPTAVDYIDNKGMIMKIKHYGWKAICIYLLSAVMSVTFIELLISL